MTFGLAADLHRIQYSHHDRYDRRIWVACDLARSAPFAQYQDCVTYPCVGCVNGYERVFLVLASLVHRLHLEQFPATEGGMLNSGDDRTDDSADDHITTLQENTV